MLQITTLRWFNHLQVLFALTFLISATNVAALSYETDQLTNDVIKSYQSKNYERTVALCDQELKAHTDNVVVRYYLAQTLVSLRRYDEALKHYKLCARLSDDPQMQAYCEQAIRSLTSNPTALSVKPPSNSGQSAASVVDPEIAAQKETILKEGSNEIEFLKKQAERDIAREREEAIAELDGVPPTFSRPYYCNGILYNQEVPNPDYEPTKERVEARIKAKTEEINQRLEKQKAQLEESYSRKANSL